MNLVLLVVACSPVAHKPDARATATASSGAPAVDAKDPSARFEDALWARAREGDPLDVARLAEREGAAGLLDALRDGGEVEIVALAALPLAPDADAGLRALCARATSLTSGPRRARLEAVVGIAGRPREQREALDPEGARDCAASLVGFAKRRDAPAEHRALAVSAARALADKGYLDPRSIPTDLDAR